MAAIDEIPGINGATLDLFRAAGIHSSGDLAGLSSEELLGRLDEANAESQLLARLPAVSALRAWRSAAKVFEGGPGRERTKLSSDVMKAVRAPGLPTARQLSSAQLREAGIPAGQVPIGKLLAEIEEELDHGSTKAVAASNGGDHKPAKVMKRRVEDPVKEKTEQLEDEPEFQPDREERKPLVASGHLQVRERGAKPAQEEREEFAPMAESQPAQRRVEKRNHGMMHKEPGRVYAGALATLLAMVLGGAGFIVVGGVLFYALYYGVSVPWWALFVLPAFPVAVILHVTLGLRPRCRLCGQQLFRPKACNKHVKAHRSPFGPIFATALHAVTCRWFRCMLCGTKQRLRE